MSIPVAASDAADLPPPPPGRLGRLGRWLVRPPQTGWVSIVVLGIMLLIAGLAMDAPRLAGRGPSGASQTAFLPLVVVLGGLTGLVLARLPLPALLAHLVDRKSVV